MTVNKNEMDRISKILEPHCSENNKCSLCDRWINSDNDLPLNCEDCPTGAD